MMMVAVVVMVMTGVLMQFTQQLCGGHQREITPGQGRAQPGRLHPAQQGRGVTWTAAAHRLEVATTP